MRLYANFGASDAHHRLFRIAQQLIFFIQTAAVTCEFLIQQVPQHHVQNVITLVIGADLIPTPYPR